MHTQLTAFEAHQTSPVLFYSMLICAFRRVPVMAYEQSSKSSPTVPQFDRDASSADIPPASSSVATNINTNEITVYERVLYHPLLEHSTLYHNEQNLKELQHHTVIISFLSSFLVIVGTNRGCKALHVSITHVPTQHHRLKYFLQFATGTTVGNTCSQSLFCTSKLKINQT